MAESLNSESTDILKELLSKMIRTHSYREGNFVLASGKTSPFYVDMKNVSLHPRGAQLIGELAWRLLEPGRFGGVGGPTLGADPLATALSLRALDKEVNLPAFIIRKEPKAHGTSQWIEGRENLKAGVELLMLEDVVTTGGSSLKAIEKVRAEGFKVNHLLAVLDRRQGASQALAAKGVELTALTTIDEVRALSGVEPLSI